MMAFQKAWLLSRSNEWMNECFTHHLSPSIPALVSSSPQDTVETSSTATSGALHPPWLFSSFTVLSAHCDWLKVFFHRDPHTRLNTTHSGLTAASSLDVFKKQLKSHLFSLVFSSFILFQGGLGLVYLVSISRSTWWGLSVRSTI